MTAFNPALISSSYLGGAGLGTQQFTDLAGMAQRAQQFQFEKQQAAIRNNMDAQRLGMAQEDQRHQNWLFEQQQQDAIKNNYVRQALSQQFKAKKISASPVMDGPVSDVDAAFQGGSRGGVQRGASMGGGSVQAPGYEQQAAQPQALTPDIEKHNADMDRLAELVLHVPDHAIPMMASLLDDSQKAKDMANELAYLKSSSGARMLNSISDPQYRDIAKAYAAMGDFSGSMHAATRAADQKVMARRYEAANQNRLQVASLRIDAQKSLAEMKRGWSVVDAQLKGDAAQQRLGILALSEQRKGAKDLTTALKYKLDLLNYDDRAGLSHRDPNYVAWLNERGKAESDYDDALKHMMEVENRSREVLSGVPMERQAKQGSGGGRVTRITESPQAASVRESDNNHNDELPRPANQDDIDSAVSEVGQDRAKVLQWLKDRNILPPQ